MEATVETIKELVAAIGVARSIELSAEPEAQRWVKEFLIGFSLLAIGEARSMVLLLSDRLNRHARVHLRALYEYQLRASLLLEDPERALAFRDSLAYEMRHLIEPVGLPMPPVEAAIADSLGVPDASMIKGNKESLAFGGSVRDQMKDGFAPERR